MPPWNSLSVVSSCWIIFLMCTARGLSCAPSNSIFNLSDVFRNLTCIEYALASCTRGNYFFCIVATMVEMIIVHIRICGYIVQYCYFNQALLLWQSSLVVRCYVIIARYKNVYIIEIMYFPFLAYLEENFRKGIRKFGKRCFLDVVKITCYTM